MKGNDLVYKYRISALILLILLVLSLSAWSQPDFDQATKEVDRALLEDLEKKLTPIPKKPPEIEEEEEKEKPVGPSFFVKNIVLRGVKSFPLDDFELIIQKYENRELTISDLKILAREIEREYLKKGVIAACFLPPQDIKNGLVVLKIIEAKMGKLHIGKQNYFFEDRTAYYWSIKPDDILRYDKMSRILQHINKNPDRNVKATLHAGKKPETTDITLTAKTTFPIHFTASLDREGSITTGRMRKGFGFINNNFTGMDDTLIFGYTGGKFFSGVYAYHKIPITNYGTSVMYGYSQSRAFPKKDFATYEISSRSEVFSASLHQDLYEKANYVGEVNLGLDAKDKLSSWSQGTLAMDRLRILKVGGFFMDRGPRNIVSLSPKFYQGLNFLGAKRRNEFSSRNTENTFSKLTLSSNFRQTLTSGFQVNIKANGQFAGQGLASQEEMYLGGIDSVRGYPAGDFLADNGFYANFDLLIPAFIIPETLRFPYGSKPIRDDITAVAFFDYGYGIKRNASSSERDERRLASLGFGTRIRLLDQATLRLEWGWPLDIIADMPLSEFAHSRFHFSINFQDKLPGEIQRVYKEIKKDNVKYQTWAILNEEMKNENSILPKTIYHYLKMAKNAEETGNLKEAKKYYIKLANAGKSAYRQVKNYLDSVGEQRKILNKENKDAMKYYKEGEFEKAKELWQNIIENAKMKPLVVEVL